jgi:ubiquinone/menaquinone biosynthesis C-methylase UbiE
MDMTVTTPKAPGLASRLVNGFLGIKPLADLAKQKARSMMIERAESIGVQWRQEAEALRSRGEAVWDAERRGIEDATLAYPAYYLKSFHAYESGNLSWDAAMEVEVASYAVHAQIWSKPGDKTGDVRLRKSYHDLLAQHLHRQPQTAVDLGCGTGLSSFALQALFPAAAITGVDLSAYFLTVAQYQSQRRGATMDWKHTAAEATALATASFDLVSSCLLFHELPQLAIHEILQEARRLLRPGGYFALMDMNPQSDVFLKMPPYILTLLKCTEPYLDDYFTLDLESAISQAGFQSPQVFSNSPRHRTLIAQAT